MSLASAIYLDNQLLLLIGSSSFEEMIEEISFENLISKSDFLEIYNSKNSLLFLFSNKFHFMLEDEKLSLELRETYEEAIDAYYLYLYPSASGKTGYTNVLYPDDFVIDFNKDGTLFGVEILNLKSNYLS